MRVRTALSCLRALGPASGPRAVLDSACRPLLAAVGLSPTDAGCVHQEGLLVHLPTGVGSTVLVATPWDAALDPAMRMGAAEGARVMASWSISCNGTHLRISDVARSWTRRFIEFDLTRIVTDDQLCERLATVLHAVAAPAGDGRTRLHAFASDSAAQGASVCRSLQSGVLEAAGDLLDALARLRRTRRQASLDPVLEQALTVVYRLLFLLFAEARGLVPTWHPVYRTQYSVDALRRAVERAPQQQRGLWETVQAMVRLAHAGCRLGTLRVTAFNGRLFAPARTPLADGRGLDDRALERALVALSTTPGADGRTRERIAYQDLGVEQLGAVYETLLDYRPVRAPAGRRRIDGRPARGRVTLERGSDARKRTGAFYTPQPIADDLVRTTLGPLVRGRAAEEILALKVVDPAMGSGAFLVAACRFLAEAYETARVRDGALGPAEATPTTRAATRRLIAERCLYGVDINPFAVQLARLSIWLTTLAADRPLTFLDHHLAVGDSLVGAPLAGLSRHPAAICRPRSTPAAPGTPTLFDDLDITRAVAGTLPVRLALEHGPGDSLDAVRTKERALARLGRPDAAMAPWRTLAHAWCAHWFDAGVPGRAFHAVSDAVLGRQGPLPAHTLEALLARAEAVAACRRFFHWELEFPEVFFGPDGRPRPRPGFDAVIGNPPWDMLRADTATGEGDGDRRNVERYASFVRESGLYRTVTRGQANRYQLFIERSLDLARSGGRVGLVVPGGLLSDHGSAALRARLFDTCDLERLVGFDNRRGIFPIHRSVRFVSFTAAVGAVTDQVRCRFGLQDPDALDTPATGAGAADVLDLHRRWLTRVSGPGLDVPDLRSPLDVAILDRAVTLFPPLGSASGWRAEFGRELNATDDRACFKPAGQGWPVLDGRHLSPFRCDVSASARSVSPRDGRRLLGAKAETPRLAYRDVAGAGNRLTLIAAIVPAHCATTHTIFCLKTRVPAVATHYLTALFNSLVVNYLVRMRVSTHVTTAIVERLPTPPPSHAGVALHRLAALARRLSRQDDGAAAAELQGCVARLYQLTRREFVHVLGTFPLVEPAAKAAALAWYDGHPHG